MVAASRFAVAVHCLTLLATNPGEPLTSEYLASSVNTNPVVVRRVLGQLRRAHLVASTPGTSGGWRMRRPAHTISLGDAYAAVSDSRLLGLHARPPNPRCAVGRTIQSSLTVVFDAAERALTDRLESVSVADVLRDVELRSGALAG
jgi:Rrf2 family protein